MVTSRVVLPRTTVKSRFINALLLLGGVAVLVLGISVRLADLQVQTVLSNSMQPAFSAGDLVVTQPIPVDAVVVGDVIAFVPPDGSRPVIHRVASIQGGVVTTRGDANSVDDPWLATLAGPTAYRLVATVPYAGWLAELQRPVLLLAGLFGVLAVLLGLRKEVARRTQTPASTSVLSGGDTAKQRVPNRE